MSQGQEPGQNLQALSQQLQELDQVQAQLETQREATEALRNEVEDAIEALGELETGSTVQVPLGGDAYVRAEIVDIDEVIVDVGADYAVEQPQGDAVEVLEGKRDQLEETIDELDENLEEVNQDIQEVETHAQQLRQQMLQQQQGQQLGGGGLGGGSS